MRQALKVLPVVFVVLALGASCAAAPEDLRGALTDRPDAPTDPLTEAAEAGPTWERTSPEFCAGVAALTSASALSVDQVIERYRELLLLAPPEITAEIEALLEYLTSGTAPEFAEEAVDSDAESSPPVRASDPTDDDAEPEADDWRDDLLYGTGDAEQVAVMMAEFLEFRCRGTAVNPLPPPSGLENQQDN